MDFRRATEDDVPAITRIYNEGIEDRVATLETEPRTEDERLKWLRGHGDRYPVFVAVRGRTDGGAEGRTEGGGEGAAEGEDEGEAAVGQVV